ncbi:roadblock/LC7 domain-containing protein [Pseudonocardia pini]|uniref:roadblock/LC7 domain-containing protein n=1 Tax=Pseudonocardia pini TaxID=2758030 RepID=UPI0015F11B20|nr:roadblock/LC7 domain-containing protein [Pseudonocardia pini]
MSGFDWQLTDFARRVPGVLGAVLVSADGLCLATSESVGETLGDQLAAAASGLASLSHGAASLLGSGPVAQTVLEMEQAYLFVGAVGVGALLAVHADRRSDIGAVGYEMAMLAVRVGHSLEPGLRGTW